MISIAHRNSSASHASNMHETFLWNTQLRKLTDNWWKIPFSSSKFTLASQLQLFYWFCGHSQESLYSKQMAMMEYFDLIHKTLVFVSHDSQSHIFFFSLSLDTFTLCLKICKIWLLSSSTFTILWLYFDSTHLIDHSKRLFTSLIS